MGRKAKSQNQEAVKDAVSQENAKTARENPNGPEAQENAAAELAANQPGANIDAGEQTETLTDLQNGESQEQATADSFNTNNRGEGDTDDDSEDDSEDDTDEGDENQGPTPADDAEKFKATDDETNAANEAEGESKPPAAGALKAHLDSTTVTNPETGETEKTYSPQNPNETFTESNAEKVAALAESADFEPARKPGAENPNAAYTENYNK